MVGDAFHQVFEAGEAGEDDENNDNLIAAGVVIDYFKVRTGSQKNKSCLA